MGIDFRFNRWPFKINLAHEIMVFEESLIPDQVHLLKPYNAHF